MEFYFIKWFVFLFLSVSNEIYTVLLKLTSTICIPQFFSLSSFLTFLRTSAVQTCRPFASNQCAASRLLKIADLIFDPYRPNLILPISFILEFIEPEFFQIDKYNLRSWVSSQCVMRPCSFYCNSSVFLSYWVSLCPSFQWHTWQTNALVANKGRVNSRMTLKLIRLCVREYLSLKTDLFRKVTDTRVLLRPDSQLPVLCLLVSLSVGISWPKREADNSSVKLAIHLCQLQRLRVIISLPSVLLYISTMQCKNTF